MNELQDKIDEAISHNDYQRHYELVIQIFEIASTSLSKPDWNLVPWYETINLYTAIIEINAPRISFPILESKKEKKEKLPWEYEGRTWYFWYNLFASNYGWDGIRIGALDLDDALGLYQEILIKEQLEKEWEWGMSEIAYPYNSNTKKQEYKALERPNWMLPIAPDPLPIITMRKDMVPQGNVVDLTVKHDK